MSGADDDEIFDDPLSASRGRPIENHYHYSQRKNGNGDVNRVVWAVAAFATVSLVTITAFFGVKIWGMSESVARLEAQMTIVLQRLPPP